MKLENIHNVYFIGIGGIGMSAIARYFSEHGKNVAGYDKTPSPITDDLSKNGIEIHFDDVVEKIPSSFLNKEKTLVVYTPAIPKQHKEFDYFFDCGYLVMKRAEVLGVITRSTFCLGVAGTHGKTTTSSILGHIMQTKNATAFLGGIAENYQSNLILGGNEISVVEADEFDRSFLQLSPNVACITSVDADHLDIYGEHKELLKSFKEFSDKVSDTLIVAKGIGIKGLTYAIDEQADYRAINIRIKNGTYIFDVETPTSEIKDIQFNLPGRHNVMNALASIAMADVCDVSLIDIKESLSTFKGVKRRFSYRIKSDDIVFIDDYAHHPTEIKSVCESVREMYPNDKVLAVFQPHLFSRTKDFVDDFAYELSKFDELLLLPIYPARELLIEGVTSEWLCGKVSLDKKELVSKENLTENILNTDAKVIVMMGAGDIGLLVNLVKDKLIVKYNI